MTAPPQGVEVDRIEFPAGTIQYYRAGTTGTPVVLLHGGGPDNALLSWRNTFGTLAPDHQVYAPDLPGQGGSVAWRGRANQRTFEEVLRWLLDAWEIPQAILVGLSMGGSIATGFTLRHPHRVRGLVLVDSTGLQHKMPRHLLTYLVLHTDFTGRTAANLLRRSKPLARATLDRVFFSDPSKVTDLDSIVTEVVAEAGVRRSVFADWHSDAIGRKNMNINHSPQLGRIACPTMVIHGENDRLVPVSTAREVAGAIANSTLRVVPEAGHWPNREKSTEFNSLLREFVNGLAAEDAAKTEEASEAEEVPEAEGTSKVEKAPEADKPSNVEAAPDTADVSKDDAATE